MGDRMSSPSYYPDNLAEMRALIHNETGIDPVYDLPGYVAFDDVLDVAAKIHFIATRSNLPDAIEAIGAFVTMLAESAAYAPHPTTCDAVTAANDSQ